MRCQACKGRQLRSEGLTTDRDALLDTASRMPQDATSKQSGTKGHPARERAAPLSLGAFPAILAVPMARMF